jgi:site-specific recombinase XerD
MARIELSRHDPAVRGRHRWPGLDRQGLALVEILNRSPALAVIPAKLPFQVHPHMLRHGCGFKLANDGVDTRSLQHYLGHKNIQHTVRYTELRSDRFNGFRKN